MPLAAILAWLKGLAFLSKVASIAGPLAAFVPGAQIIAGVSAIVTSIASAVGQVIKWAWSGVVVCFSHPTAFIVCLGFMLSGAWSYAHYHRDLVADLRTELATAKAQRDKASTELKGWHDRYDGEKRRADEAEAARKKAESERDQRVAAVPAQPSAVGVRPGPAARRPGTGSRPAQPAEYGLFKGLFTYPAGPGR